MSLRSEYDNWHRRIHEADPEHDDTSSPWHELVREYLGGVAGLSIRSDTLRTPSGANIETRLLRFSDRI
jgi:hypothetical protein